MVLDFAADGFSAGDFGLSSYCYDPVGEDG